MPKIKLQSSEGDIFDVDMETAKCLGTIKFMLEDCKLENDENETIVPLTKVNSFVLRIVLNWAEYHKDDPELPEHDLGPWDADLLKVDHGTLFELIMAANYLDVKGLLTLCCKTVANMIKGKTPEEMRQTFNITNDFTPAEEAMLQENEWNEME
ncbi:S-phase kinase-associated protein 1-like [Drosophila subobscura]|uniref:S-phase kinase-associated protein 1-like n=1 Tax=Drosophila subobscura TaxID=7241 RepID=UPI00155A96A6|nr:S-phase kinase-associated protein 1-like [Drosophila subobscura]